MKSLIIAAALVCASSAATAQINVNIHVGQPDFYGALDLDNARPRLYATQPVIIERHDRYVAQPVYLRVPPGHRKNWRKHCGRYDACDRRVLFVRDDWYQNTYAPRYRASHGRAEPVRHVVERRVEHHYVDRNDRNDNHRGKHDDKHDNKHDKKQDKHHDKGHDKGHGKGHDKH